MVPSLHLPGQTGYLPYPLWKQSLWMLHSAPSKSTMLKIDTLMVISTISITWLICRAKKIIHFWTRMIKKTSLKQTSKKGTIINNQMMVSFTKEQKFSWNKIYHLHEFITKISSWWKTEQAQGASLCPWPNANIGVIYWETFSPTENWIIIIFLLLVSQILELDSSNRLHIGFSSSRIRHYHPHGPPCRHGDCINHS